MGWEPPVLAKLAWTVKTLNYSTVTTVVTKWPLFSGAAPVKSLYLVLTALWARLHVPRQFLGHFVKFRQGTLFWLFLSSKHHKALETSNASVTQHCSSLFTSCFKPVHTRKCSIASFYQTHKSQKKVVFPKLSNRKTSHHLDWGVLGFGGGSPVLGAKLLRSRGLVRIVSENHLIQHPVHGGVWSLLLVAINYEIEDEVLRAHVQWKCHYNRSP